MYYPNQTVFDLTTEEPRNQNNTQNPTCHLIWSNKGYKNLPKEFTHNSFFNSNKKRIWCLHDGIFHGDVSTAKRMLNLGYILPAALHTKEEQIRNIKRNKEQSLYNLKQQITNLISAAKYTIESFVKGPFV